MLINDIEIMEIYSTSEARANLFELVKWVSSSHQPAYIIGKKHKAVILSEEDYSGLIETLYISSIPGLKESIIQSRNSPIEEFSSELDWGDGEDDV
jgi:antitoxin YefM